MKFFFKVILACGVLLTGIKADGQVRITSEEELELLRETSMEAVYMHTNGPLFFPGEYMYYSLYCIDLNNYRLSNLSKVAYVQLIDESGLVAFTQKVGLDRGKGQGDYFFPTDLPSGNYKLVGFTHWMKNAGPEQYFMADITFINPYRADQNVFLNPETSSSCAGTPDSVGEQNTIDQAGEVLTFELQKNLYELGEEVVLQLKNYKGALGRGTYSLSVRKSDELPHAGLTSAEAYAERYDSLQKGVTLGVNDILSIPEQRGDLVSGRVFDQSDNTPVSDQTLAISLPGDDFRVKKALTDQEGKFYTYITRPYSGEFGVAEVLPPRDATVSISWFSPEKWEVDIPCFYSFSLDSTMAESIRKRSVHNQIENSFFEAKPDSILSPELGDPFKGDVPLVFELDSYTRFPTLRETLVEVVNHVGVRRNDSGGYMMWVNPTTERPGSEYMGDPPLVLIDGILIPEPESIMDYDARKIARIKVLREPYQLGGVSYQGMVVIETVDRIYASEWESDFGSRFNYLSPQPSKRYFRQGQPSSHVPDFRYQLLWEPLIELGETGQTFTFFTSQVPGNYEIRLEGYTSYGKPVSLSVGFVVSSE